MSVNLLSVSGVTFGEEKNYVLRDIRFSQNQFQKIVIAGETGSGKSTLLKIIAGLEQPYSGEVIFENEKVKGPADQLVPGHPQIVYLSQQFELPKFLRVEQVLEYANQLKSTPEEKIFSVCRINHLLTRKTNELSGGEKQRIAIARLLIQRPKLLLLDEPFSNLDQIMKGILKEVIDDIGKKLKITCILVSHDPEDTLPWADEILVLKSGKIIQRGSPQEIYHHPISPYVAGLFGTFTMLNIDLIKKFGIKTSAKKIIVRPENFQLTAKGTKTVSGHVDKINFYGNHFLLEVLTKQQRIFVITNNRLQPGEWVNLKLILP
ncbi:MAG TPA: ABC transporter ATP-binding protein [Cyclobacteriaceae bacterium]|jgi:iron(III) transport system ATP-binding protein|nr:ABC transporter ATP-binding protein [Cyclobacteriaceae bacterium]